MSGAERALYDDVTRYLLEPSILAFQGKQRQLLLLGFHRRMASSTAALAASLERVAARLAAWPAAAHSDGEALDQPRPPQAASSGASVDSARDGRDSIEHTHAAERPGEPPSDDDLLADFTRDLDDAPKMSLTRVPRRPGLGDVLRLGVAAELARVEGFVTRARAAADDDAKFCALASAIAFIDAARVAGKDSGKLVIFTESLVTQAHVRAQLLAHRLVTYYEVHCFAAPTIRPAPSRRSTAGAPR